ncbi:M20/M25/M40 family metallo-hydrolase [Bacteroidota bacterium]
MKKYYILAFFLLTAPTLNSIGQGTMQEQLEKIVYELASDDYLGRGFGTEQGKKAADFIAGEFEKAGIEPFLETYFQSFDHRSGILNISGRNVVGIVRGSDPELKDEYIILGAHYDHVGWKIKEGDTVVYNGADDNASGVAGIIEIGRVLGEKKENLKRNVILVAFDGEESGLIGSNAFVKELMSGENMLIDASSVVVMFSLDMIGMYEAHGGVDLLGMELIKNADELLSMALGEKDLDIKKKNDAVPQRTDTTPFGNIGIPSVHVFTGTESPYHKPEDDSDLLDFEGMKEITDFMVILVEDLAQVPEVDKNKQMESIAESGEALKYFNPGLTLQLGGSHFDFRNDYYKAKGVFSYTAGVFLQSRVTSWLTIQPEVFYEWGGSQTQAGKLYMHSLTVPVSLLMTTPDASGLNTRAFYQVGAYYRYTFAGAENGTALNIGTDYLSMDYGIVFGIGFEIMNYRLAYVFQQSLRDITLTDNPNLDTRLKGSFVKIGWVF